MKIKKKLNILQWKLIKKLPPNIRGKIARANFKMNIGTLDGFEFKIVDNFDEALESMQIVQEIYKKSQLAIDKSLLRVSKYNLLPTTHIFVAINSKTKEIVATISVVPKTGIKLPIEDSIDISSYIRDGNRSCEFSALSVKEEYRSRSSGLFVGLTLYAMKYSREVLGFNHFFISVRKSVKVFYEDMFSFHQIGQAKAYEGVNGSIGVPMHFYHDRDIRKVEQNFGNKPLEKNVYRLYKELPWQDKCVFEGHKYQLISRFYLKDEELDYIRDNKDGFLSDFECQDIIMFNNIYFRKYIENTNIKNDSDQSDLIKRKEPRFCVYQQGQTQIGGKNKDLNILEVSRRGLVINTIEDLAINQFITISACIQKNKEVSLKAQVKWFHDNQYGLSILSCKNRDWESMIDSFESILNNQEVDQVVETKPHKKAA